MGIIDRLQNFCNNTSNLFINYSFASTEQRMLRRMGPAGFAMMNMYGFGNQARLNRSVFSGNTFMPGGCTNMPGMYGGMNQLGGYYGDFNDSVFNNGTYGNPGSYNAGLSAMAQAAEVAKQQMFDIFSKPEPITDEKNKHQGSITDNTTDNTTSSATSGKNDDPKPEQT